MCRGGEKGLQHSCTPPLRPHVPSLVHYQVVGQMLFVSSLSDGRVAQREENCIERGLHVCERHGMDYGRFSKLLFAVPRAVHTISITCCTCDDVTCFSSQLRAPQ